MNLANKTILITGATGGIGKALAHSLAAKNCNLILVARKLTLLKSLSKTLIKQHKIAVSYFSCNLRDKTARKRLISKLRRRATRLDCLVNSAGIGVYKPFDKVTEKDWENSYDLNVTAPYFLTQGLLPMLKTSKLSLILNIGSGAGVTPMPERSIYCSTKFALRGWTLSLAEETREKSPHFCLITLGSTLTSFGTTTLAEKKAKQAGGKAYLTPEFVADQLVAIIADSHRATEYTMYPANYNSSVL